MKADQATRLTSGAVAEKRAAEKERRHAKTHLREQEKHYQTLLVRRDAVLNVLGNEVLAAAAEGHPDFVMTQEAWEHLRNAETACTSAANLALREHARLPAIFAPLSVDHFGHATSSSAAGMVALSKEQQLRESLLSAVLSLDVSDVRRLRNFLEVIQGSDARVASFPKDKTEEIARTISGKAGHRFRRDFSDLLRWIRNKNQWLDSSQTSGVWFIWDRLRALDTPNTISVALGFASYLGDAVVVARQAKSPVSFDVLQCPALLAWLSTSAQSSMEQIFETIRESASAGLESCTFYPMQDSEVTTPSTQIPRISPSSPPSKLEWSPPGCDAGSAIQLLLACLTALGYSVVQRPKPNVGSVEVSW